MITLFWHFCIAIRNSWWIGHSSVVAGTMRLVTARHDDGCVVSLLRCLPAEGVGSAPLLPADHLRSRLLPSPHDRTSRPEAWESAPRQGLQREDCRLRSVTQQMAAPTPNGFTIASGQGGQWQIQCPVVLDLKKKCLYFLHYLHL